MAYQPTHFESEKAGFLSAAFGAISGFFVSLGRALATSSAYTVRVQNFQALHAKSDAELKALGIKREDIVHHVFQDLYYA
ncbi:hypothetical protein [Roseobacter sp.]|uniref:hypothetical protein n=1 Tax=Roseobacter sp. TaxID=1907202 RepID=UPI00385B07D4